MNALRTGTLLALSALIIGPVLSGDADHARKRTFEFTMAAEIPALQEGTRRLDVWLPYPASDLYQEASDIRVSSDLTGEVTRDPEYGNTILHLYASRPEPRAIHVMVRFRVTRSEHVNRPGMRTPGRAVPETPGSLARWLAPDRLVPLDDRIRELARQVTRGERTPAARARAIYDYVVSTMSYDKSGTGWGNGDLRYACDMRKGNCTDFHALFIGLARASGIPARFEIGFPLPETPGAGEVAGYHCWAEFWLDGAGWVPVDCSEAQKHPERRDYFFGAHCENRVQLSVGRDLVLAPPQAGPPLNYFVYPYAEADGRPLTDLKERFTYRDLHRAPSSGS